MNIIQYIIFVFSICLMFTFIQAQPSPDNSEAKSNIFQAQPPPDNSEAKSNIIQAQPPPGNSEAKSDHWCGTTRETENSLKLINDWFKSLSQDQRDKMNAHASSVSKTQFGSPNKDEIQILGSATK